MANRDNPIFGATEDALAALSDLSQSLAIIAARSAHQLRSADLDELERAIAAADRCATYLRAARRELQAQSPNNRYPTKGKPT